MTATFTSELAAYRKEAEAILAQLHKLNVKTATAIAPLTITAEQSALFLREFIDICTASACAPVYTSPMRTKPEIAFLTLEACATQINLALGETPFMLRAEATVFETDTKPNG